MLLRPTHKSDVGAAAEYVVASYLLQAGFEVFAPLKSQSRIDLIYVRDLEPLKVQVKCATRAPQHGFIYEQVRLSRCEPARPHGGGYILDEVDEFWIVGTHLWKVPGDLLSGRTSVVMGSNNPSPYRARRPGQFNPDAHVEVRGTWDAPFRHRLWTQAA